MVFDGCRRCSDYSAVLDKYKWIHQHFLRDTDCVIVVFALG